MRISGLYLKNFRNYKEEKAAFLPGLNVICGKNAMGKTNMLEAVYLSAVARSPRTFKDKELIMEGAEYSTIVCQVEKKYRSHKIEIHIDQRGKKRVIIDSIPVNRAGELLGILNVVYFSPDELKLIKEAPENRRKFLDISLSQQQKSYFNALSSYTKALKQKNNLLKTGCHGKDADGMLDVWDETLATHGATLVKKRFDFLSSLAPMAKEIHASISKGSEEMTLTYEADYETTKEGILNALLRSREKDKKLQYTSAGPHRDDIKIEINGKDVRKFASQGQQRTAALSLKLAEMKMFRQETGEVPVLLLDDVLSELDETRKEILINMAQSCQTLLTCTEYIGERSRLFTIENGKIIDIKDSY